MRLAHLSDLHLGFRAFPREVRGRNLREQDLATAFRWALQELVRLKPDLILLTGDIFDRPDPPSTAFLTLHRGLSSLQAQLPSVPVLVIAGERDTPLSPAEPGPVAILDTLPGIEAAAGAPRAVRFRGTGVHALLVPHRAAIRPPFPTLRPDPDARWNLLLLRGDPDRDGTGISVDSSQWSYVAIGGSHRSRAWQPHVRTAGALERPGWDPWRHTTEERGFLTFDLERGIADFHNVPGRPLVDLAPIRVQPDDPDAGSRRLRELVEGIPGGIEGKLVRARLVGDITSPEAGISAGLIAAIRHQAGHLEIQLSDEAPPASHSSGTAPARWRPRALLANLSQPSSPTRFSLEPGLFLVTSHSEEIRATLANELREESRPATGSGIDFGLRIDPALPSTPAARALWTGHDNPLRFLQTDWAPHDQDVPSPPTPATSPQGHPLEELDSREQTLRNLRADAVEASGELEALTMAWARERQEAISRLQAYRERAEELRDRLRDLEASGEATPCPTCGRELGSEYARTLQTLKEEWEAVVQDGRWWKRRREQLDGKPEDIRSLEQTAHRLHAEVETAAERLQLVRSGRQQPQGETRRSDLPDAEGLDSAEPIPVATPEVRAVLRGAASLMNRFTEGTVSGLRIGSQGLELIGATGRVSTPRGSEDIALRIAIQLSLWQRTRASGQGLDGVLFWQLHEAGSEALALRVLSVMDDLVSQRSTVMIAVVPPGVLARMSERVHTALVCETDPQDRPLIHSMTGGIPPLSLQPGA